MLLLKSNKREHKNEDRISSEQLTVSVSFTSNYEKNLFIFKVWNTLTTLTTWQHTRTQEKLDGKRVTISEDSNHSI